MVWVYTAKMFPTEIRSMALGASSLCGRVGGILAPPVLYLSSAWVPLPFIIMGSGSLVGGVLILLVLPETLGRCLSCSNTLPPPSKLPDTMEEALNLGRTAGKQGSVNGGLEGEEE